MPGRPTTTQPLHSRALAMLLLCAMLTVLAAPRADAATYVIPHWIETSGSTSTATYAFDDFIYMRYTPGLAGTASGSGATVGLYLYDNSTGAPLAIAGTQICNPCSYSLGGANPRNAVASIGQLITAKTGFVSSAYVGYAVLAVGGADPGGVTLEQDLVNSHSSAFDLSVTATPPLRLRKEDPALPAARVFSIPHMLDTSGSTSTQTYAFDETIFATYTGGQAGTTGSGGATVSLYLYDEDSAALLTNNGMNVCAPCVYGIGGANPRKLALRMEDLIVAATGSMDALAKRAAGVVVVGGSDPGNVTLQPWLINSHSNTFDLGVTAQTAQPVSGAGLLAVLPDDRGTAVRSLSVSPNPAQSNVRISFDLAQAGDVDLAIYDVSGREVATVFRGRWDAGAHELGWDGRDASGRPVEGGIYFARMNGADHSTVSRVVMLK